MWWKKHVIISIFISILYYIFTLNFFSAILLFLAGVFIDVDHYLLYIFFKKGGFSDFYKKYYNIVVENEDDKEFVKYVIPFHSFEFMILLIILGYFNPFFVPITIGALSHFITDLIWIRRFKLKNYYSLIYYFSKFL